MSNNQGEQLKTSFGYINYFFADKGQERTLILLHGNSGSGRSWKPLMETTLSESFNFLTFDLPGHGNSPVPDNPQEAYSLPAYSDVLVELIAHFALQNYVLFGHSLGGHIILESLNHLKSCKGAMIMGTPPLSKPPQLEKAFLMSEQFLSFMQSGSDREVIERTFKSMLTEEHGDIANLLFEDYFKTDPQARELLTHSIYQGKHIDEIKALEQASIPVYIIVAEEDQMVNPAYFEEFIPGQELIIIQGAGHYVPLEMPEKFARIITEKFIG